MSLAESMVHTLIGSTKTKRPVLRAAEAADLYMRPGYLVFRLKSYSVIAWIGFCVIEPVNKNIIGDAFSIWKSITEKPEEHPFWAIPQMLTLKAFRRWTNHCDT